MTDRSEGDTRKSDPVGADDRRAGSPEQRPLCRRSLLKGGGALATLAGGVMFVRPGAAQDRGRGQSGNGGKDVKDRRAEAARLRREAAEAYLDGQLPAQETNGDESLYPDLRASFCKTLPQNELGEPDPIAFDAFVAALESRRAEDLDAIALSPFAERMLANPHGAHAYEMTGLDGQATRMPAPPSFAGATQAAEMGEVYWQALTRDVPFLDYQSDPTVAAAVADLNAFSSTVGPTEGALVTPGTISRG